MPSLTVSRAVLAFHGASAYDLNGPTLTPEATRALEPWLRARDFDLSRPIYVQELPGYQGFT
jgi:hypothetical protein